MNMDEKADIFKSQIEQVVGEKLNNLVFLATYKEEGHDKTIISTNGELTDHVQMLIDLLTHEPVLAAALAASLSVLDDEEED